MEESSTKAIAGAAKAWAPVAKALIEKFSVGRLYDPVNAWLMNEVENRNRLRDAKNDMEIIQVMAQTRAIKEQSNIDVIPRMAAPMLTDKAKPEEMKPDWINVVKEKTKVVEDDDMRILWAKLVAGEAEKPGSFPKRVLDEVARLSKEEARAFTEVARFCWEISTRDGDTTSVLVLGKHIEVNDSLPLHLLQDTHLMEFSSTDLLRFHGVQVGTIVPFAYFGKKCETRLKTSRGIALSGSVSLTAIGASLVPIAGGTRVDGEFEKMLVEWSQGNVLQVTSHD